MDAIEINGKTYSKEDVEKAREIVMKVWDNIKDFFNNLRETIISVVSKAISHLVNNPPVGYKRLIKASQLKEYEANSEGKSNNWRKIHGLPLVRNRCRYREKH